MSYYVAILDGGKNVWGVRFPDFPGCHGGGPTPEAAIADATSALRVFAGMMVADGEAIPRARTPVELAPGERPREGESLVMIPLVLDRRRPVKANISLDAGLLEAIDEEAKRRGLTRSAFLVSAAIDKIEGGGVVEQGAIPARDARHDPYQTSGFAEEASRRELPSRPRKARRR
jgi:predicted RNase H-like HicB family nuclease